MGDDEFVRQYNKLIPNTYRIVNDADVISRLPRNRVRTAWTAYATVGLT